jgi:hypothetical protein
VSVVFHGAAQSADCNLYCKNEFSAQNYYTTCDFSVLYGCRARSTDVYLSRHCTVWWNVTTRNNRKSVT